MKYEQKVLEHYAEQLEDRAGRVVGIRSVAGIVLGAVVAAVLQAFLGGKQWAIPGAVIGGLVGYAMAQSEALRLRVQAHTLLLLIQLEQNTRKDAAK